MPALDTQTMDLAPGSDTLAVETVHIGPQLRAARERAKLSVRELARQTGLSPSLVSQVENGKVLPSLATLFKLTNELGTRINPIIFGAEAKPGTTVTPNPDCVVRKGQGERIVLNSGVQWERLTPRADHGADFLHVIYDVGGSSCEGQELMRHNGREYGYILSGSLRVTIGFEAHVLTAGDSISFESSLPHRLETVGDVPAHAIWLVTGRNARA